MDITDLSHPLNPLNPISPFNPANQNGNIGTAPAEPLPHWVNVVLLTFAGFCVIFGFYISWKSKDL